MKRLLPAPWLSVALFGMWLLLNDTLAFGDLLMGAAVGLAAPLLTRRLRPLPVRLRRPLLMLRLAGAVLADAVASNIAVARVTLRGRGRPPRSGFVHMPLQLREANGLAALAAILAISPGTLWCELSPDRSMLLVHVFDLQDEAAQIQHLKARYERPLMEIFE